MQVARSWLARPGLRMRAAVGVAMLFALVPALARLPKVSVVACFESGHPLYEWVATTQFVGDVHCVSAPAPVVSWTLMIAATLLVQLVLLPLLVTAGALLARGARRFAEGADRVLAAVLIVLAALFVSEPQPVRVPARTQYRGVARTRENPHRGPPSCLS